jgi:hypothetical protein
MLPWLSIVASELDLPARAGLPPLAALSGVSQTPVGQELLG